MWNPNETNLLNNWLSDVLNDLLCFIAVFFLKYATPIDPYWLTGLKTGIIML